MFARDHWRRLVGLGLRSAASKFGLSALGLDLKGCNNASELAQRLQQFLAAEPEAHWALDHHRHVVERVPYPRPDLLLAEFGVDGSLQRIAPFLHRDVPTELPGPTRALVEESVTVAQQKTCALAEAVRGRALLGALGRMPNASLAYARRLLSAPVLSLESINADPLARFGAPDFRFRRGLGFGVLDFVARVHASSGDLWLNVHHAGADGAPMQEMLSRLEREWGVSAAPDFPCDDGAGVSMLCPAQIPATDRAISMVTDFIDFAPLLSERARFNAQLGVALPLSGFLIWKLAQEPEFAGRKFGTAVDLPPEGGSSRAVDLAAIRPSDYADQANGFSGFASDYIRLLSNARQRITPTYKAARMLAMTPLAIASRLVALDLEHGRRTFGTVGLSILKNAQVFSAPMSDFAWNDGFIAIGSMRLPALAGGSVAAVTIKGAEAQIRHYPAAIRRAISRAHRPAEH